jgi:hypothetical protein
MRAVGVRASMGSVEPAALLNGVGYEPDPSKRPCTVRGVFVSAPPSMTDKPDPAAKKFGGRKPGSKNLISRDVKARILAALDMVGGEKYLAQVARTHPAAFVALLGKVMPLQLRADVTDFRFVVQTLQVAHTPVPGVISTGLPEPSALRLVSPPKAAGDAD